MELTDDCLSVERQSGFFVGEQRWNIFAAATTTDPTSCYLTWCFNSEGLIAKMTSTAKLLALHKVVTSPLAIMWPVHHAVMLIS